jgi:hypothetical protein
MMELIHIQPKKWPTKVSDPPIDFNIQSTLDKTQVEQGQFVF